MSGSNSPMDPTQIQKMAQAIQEHEAKKRQAETQAYRASIFPKLQQYKVFAIVNKLLASTIGTTTITINQRELLSKLRQQNPELAEKTDEEIVDNDLLEFDSFYEKNWDIEYRSPGYIHGDCKRHWAFTPK